MFIACCFGGSLVVFVPLAFSQDGLVPHLHCTALSTLTWKPNQSSKHIRTKQPISCFSRESSSRPRVIDCNFCNSCCWLAQRIRCLNVGLCGYSWTWLLWYQTDCFDHRCWHYFTATWAFARQPMAWEQGAFKWGLPAAVRWHCGGNPPQHVGLDKLLRDHQPGDKPGSLFFLSSKKAQGRSYVIIYCSANIPIFPQIAGKL